jgi:ribosomal protein S12 methylthiotransferase
LPEPTRVAFVSLGCAKNLVDSEKMLGQLAESGCLITGDEAEADVMVINTCGFLSASRAEAVDVIADAVRRKQTGRLQRVVVAGCLVQRDGERLLDRVQGIDALVGVNNRDDIVRAVLNGTSRASVPHASHKAAKRGAPTHVDKYLGDYHPYINLDTARLRITPRHNAYLRISEGCNQKCTFCTIPSIRGPMHCKPPQVVLDEARELISDGAVEISLIGQDTTSYGADIGYAAGLAGLLRQLNALDGAQWIRLMYVYPSVFTDEMIDAIAECGRVVKYIDIPLQHISDRVLKAMHRRVTRAQTETLMAKIRARIPGVSIRTTMIVGFPGETDAEFEELLRFVREFGFDALGVFPYSLEAQTPAGRMKNQLPDEVKQQRVAALMQAQQEVAFQRAAAWVGRSFDVLVDGIAPGASRRASGVRSKQPLYAARHAGQAPEVDSVTLIRGRNLRPGSFCKVRCTGRADYDLVAVPVETSLPVI